jgi:hypothetical protein
MIPYVGLAERNGYTIATDKDYEKRETEEQPYSINSPGDHASPNPHPVGINEINTIKCHIG